LPAGDAAGVYGIRTMVNDQKTEFATVKDDIQNRVAEAADYASVRMVRAWDEIDHRLLRAQRHAWPFRLHSIARLTAA
jgi:hypothetical protein